MERQIAHAKINLALHVRKRRPDGYHEIETVFAFCEDGDVVEMEAANELSLVIDGPFAQGLPIADNLAIRAATAVHATAQLRLVKNLPVASGIGGGSADAAAVLRLLGKIDFVIAASLGADVPACLASTTVRGEGLGETITAAASVTGMPVLLINPRIPLSTAAVFAAWDGKDNGPLDDWRLGRNDLEPPARRIVPEIGHVLSWLASQPGVTLSRMSGSGATCFALFDGIAARDKVATQVPEKWWKMASTLR